MLKSRIISWALILAWVLFVRPAQGQGDPRTGLYQIISGHYIECCGIAGAFDHPLPNARQSFVELTVDQQRNLAQMTFLGQDTQTVFRSSPSRSPAGFTFTLTNGIVFPDRIQFGERVMPPTFSQPYLSYMISNSANALRIDGVVVSPCIGCADIPTEFKHTNVVAFLMSTMAIRVSEVEVCWNALINRTYQVQYRSTLTANAWTDLGSPLAGNGSIKCITDKLLPGQPQRFYRVLTLPE
jgi:hypothetical protein